MVQQFNLVDRWWLSRISFERPKIIYKFDRRYVLNRHNCQESSIESVHVIIGFTVHQIIYSHRLHVFLHAPVLLVLPLSSHLKVFQLQHFEFAMLQQLRDYDGKGKEIGPKFIIVDGTYAPLVRSVWMAFSNELSRALVIRGQFNKNTPNERSISKYLTILTTGFARMRSKARATCF